VVVVTYLVAELMRRLGDEDRLEVLGYLSWEEVESWRQTFSKVNDPQLMNQATTLAQQKFNLHIASSEPTTTQPTRPKSTISFPCIYIICSESPV